MKLKDLSIGDSVWFAPSKGLTPYRYRVGGLSDRGQEKRVELSPFDSFLGKICVKGSADRGNAWGWDADFAFARSREEWFDLASDYLERRRNDTQCESEVFPLYQECEKL